MALKSSIQEEKTRRLAKDYAASLVSKLATLFAALVVLPLVVRSLSGDELAKYALVSVAVNWATLINPALGPAIAVLIAKDGLVFRRPARAAAVSALAGALLLSVPASLVAMLVYRELAGGVVSKSQLAAVGIGALLASCANISDTFRIGFHRATRSSIWAVVATVISTLTVILGYKHGRGETIFFILAAFLIPHAIRAASLVDISRSFWRKLWDERNGVSIRSFGDLAQSNLPHMATQLGVFFTFPLSLMLFGWADRPRAVGVLLVCQAIAAMSQGLIASAVQPLMASVAQAVESGELNWVRTMTSGLVVASGLIGLVGCTLAFTPLFRVIEVLYLEAAPSRGTVAVLAIGIGVSGAVTTMYFVLMGSGQFRRAATLMMPGMVVSLLVAFVSSVTGSIALAVSGAVLFPSLVNLPLFGREVRKIWGSCDASLGRKEVE